MLALASRVAIQKKTFGISKWKIVKANTINDNIHLHQNVSKLQFQKNILNRALNETTCMIFIDLVEFNNGGKSMVISAHHVLFDQKGILNFLRTLNPGDCQNRNLSLFPNSKSKSFFRQFLYAIQCSWKLLKSPSLKLGSLLKKQPNSISSSVFSDIHFSEEETICVDQQAFQSGSRLGKTPFYLAASCLALKKVFANRGESPPYFWVPVPQNVRPKGKDGHLFSNQLSFLFFKIFTDNCDAVEETVKSINRQMKEQIGFDFPRKYTSLLNFFRNIPTSFFLKMAKLPTAGAFASFSFSHLGEYPHELHYFAGNEIQELLNYPPVPCPPALTIVFMRYRKKLRVVIGYVEEVIQVAEIELLKQSLGNTLMGKPE